MTRRTVWPVESREVGKFARLLDIVPSGQMIDLAQHVNVKRCRSIPVNYVSIYGIREQLAWQPEKRN